MMKNIKKERQYCECDSAVGAGPLVSKAIDQAPARADSWMARSVQFVMMWNEKRIHRNILNGLTDAQLKDIGLSKADIEKEHGRVWPNWPK
ncbi:MAG: DUF1127 domain-containing protein [Ewingella americana]|jgi:uncharacterized protein YjiS (DUF1127 family)|uniref:DUF1127 domain-containing protein n=1 Tax=Ewingella americana TaxID=41202 RepID=UPI00242BD6B0|nr:DUF1127 domain-containing protein [Ewingella americana]MCI1678787.1 DUF1127 domain-containing protein [Ewingella americana]MCI1854374.1 DUF1127 domain-containing protein [Ewingella americana]MCI1861674.1 DUF1127 domain-containing protein [Ewingella americana]MCI2141020.1 DUF1127 domain-containing protein [Ewingella americana]MCI2164138.1 DUF1127 domain-containing protein [Ewingella americana]